MDMVFVAIQMLAEAISDVLLMLAFPLTVMGMLASWTTGWLSLTLWVGFYSLIIWTLFCLVYEGSRHLCNLRMPVIQYGR